MIERSILIEIEIDREIEPATKKKDKECLTAGLTIGRRKLQLKCKFCFVFQPSFGDKFSVSCAFFRHEQRVSLKLFLFFCVVRYNHFMERAVLYQKK